MSAYTLNKMIRDVNRDTARREQFFADAAAFASGYALTEEEARAVVTRDVATLYKLGVHGLILRPFTLLHKMPEPEYLDAIRS